MEIIGVVIAAVVGIGAGAGAVVAYNKKNENGGKQKRKYFFHIRTSLSVRLLGSRCHCRVQLRVLPLTSIDSM